MKRILPIRFELELLCLFVHGPVSFVPMPGISQA